MRLEIRLFAGLKCENPELSCNGKTTFNLEIAREMTIRDLRDFLGIDRELPLLSMVNNHHEEETWILKDGDRVGMFPPIGGG